MGGRTIFPEGSVGWAVSIDLDIFDSDWWPWKAFRQIWVFNLVKVRLTPWKQSAHVVVGFPATSLFVPSEISAVIFRYPDPAIQGNPVIQRSRVISSTPPIKEWSYWLQGLPSSLYLHDESSNNLNLQVLNSDPLEAVMGLMDVIEKKTMRNYQSFMAAADIHVDLDTTFCGNYVRSCTRDHQCVAIRESDGLKLYFYRCAGFVWVNRSDAKTYAIGNWSNNNIWKEASKVHFYIIGKWIVWLMVVSRCGSQLPSKLLGLRPQVVVWIILSLYLVRIVEKS